MNDSLTESRDAVSERLLCMHQASYMLVQNKESRPCQVSCLLCVMRCRSRGVDDRRQSQENGIVWYLVILHQGRKKVPE